MNADGVLKPPVVINGNAVGAWGRVFKRDVVVIAIEPFASISKTQKRPIIGAFQRYGEFVGKQIAIK